MVYLVELALLGIISKKLCLKKKCSITVCKKYKLNLTRCFVSSGVVRENGAPNASVSTYLFHLLHCHQPLHTCPPGGPHAFL